MNSESLTLIITLAALVLMSAFFSATETAFSTINKIRLKNLASGGNKRAMMVLELSEDYDRVLSTILIGNNIVNIASASLATIIFMEFFGNAGVTISTIVMTVVVLIFGEISPKSLAKEMPERYAMFAAPLLRVFSVILTPLNIIFSQWKKLLSKAIKINNDRSITEEEIITMVEEAANEGEFDKQESELIRSAIEFNDLDVFDVLTPRTELTAVEEEDSIEKIRLLFSESGYSRLPVYRDTVDNIIGVVHLKDFFNRSSDNLADITKPVIHTIDSIKISKLLKILQEQKCHMAVVTDEFGGTIGIVTLEDIIEELVGEIWDEHDDIVKDFEQITENHYLIDGGASLEKLFRIFSINQEPDFVTVNGWVTKQLNRWPSVGDCFEYENLMVTVNEIEAHKTKQIEVTVLERVLS